MSDSQKLKPCPFCGNESPTIEPWHGGKPTKKFVECGSPGCEVNPQVTGETKKEAIGNWNTRPTTPLDSEPKGGWRPDFCPITQSPFFMWIEHPQKGLVPTYGGPYDSYTIPEPDGKIKDKTHWHDIDLYRERYDHDGGYWVEGLDGVDLRLVKEQTLMAFVWDDNGKTKPPPSPPVIEPTKEKK